MVRYPRDSESTAVARTQPEVEPPVMTTVSTWCHTSNDCSWVSKNADGIFLQ
ncbi:hypothetical protein D3C72_1567650 [compost metagenome]